jgi:hypothetical protein
MKTIIIMKIRRIGIRRRRNLAHFKRNILYKVLYLCVFNPYFILRFCLCAVHVYVQNISDLPTTSTYDTVV